MTMKTLLYRVGKTEQNYKELDDKIDTILTNHLPHISAAILSIKTRINVLTAVNVGAVIIGIIVSKIL